MTFVIDNVKVTGELPDFTKDEAARYAEYVQARVSGVTEIKISASGDGVDVSYVAHDVPFERIRRITGYLTGDLTTWNDAKRTEERERVKHLGDALAKPIPLEFVDRKYAAELGADDFYSLFYGRLLEAQKVALSNADKDDEAHSLADLIVWLLTRLEVLGYDEKARANIFAEINDIHRRLGMIQGGDGDEDLRNLRQDI